MGSECTWIGTSTLGFTSLERNGLDVGFYKECNYKLMREIEEMVNE